MFAPEKLFMLIEKSKLTKKEFCQKVGISQQTLSNVANGSDIGSRKLEVIADFFCVSMDYFFDRRVSQDSHVGHTVYGDGSCATGDIQLGQCQTEVAHLKEILAEKERTIQILLSQQNHGCKKD